MMKRTRQPIDQLKDRFNKQSNAFRYTVYGASFGIFFPLMANFIQLLVLDLPFSLQGIIAAQITTPLIWIINTAPIFLGIFARQAGKRQDQISDMNQDLHENIREHQRMVVQLERMQSDLARQVEIRTADLERRNEQLKLTAEVAREAAGLRELSDILTRTVNLISEGFGYYHTGVFLIDRLKNAAILRAASSEGGERMLRP